MIVLTDEVKAIAKKNAELFGGNLSAYLTHIILVADMNRNIQPSVEYNNENVQINGNANKVTKKVKK